MPNAWRQKPAALPNCGCSRTATMSATTSPTNIAPSRPIGCGISFMNDTLYPRFSDVEYSRRYAHVRNMMAEKGLSALVLYGTVSAYQEVLYFSNFATMREAMLVLPLEGEPTLFVEYFNHVPNARLVASITDVRWGGPDITLAAVENLRERGLSEGRIGIVGPITYKQYGVMREMLPGVEWVDSIPHMMQLRLVKSEEEIEFLRKGAEFSDLAVAALEREARPGIHEYELVAIDRKS